MTVAGSAPPVSVSALVAHIDATLHRDPTLADVAVAGEVSNFYGAASGHWYFTLKDAEAQIKCAMFRPAASRVRFALGDGQRVVARGRVAVYKSRGELQMVVAELSPEGIGALAAALEALKRKLAAEGLFAVERKRPLPPYPTRVGVVTSRDGAVWHDIQRVARARFPGVTLLLAPVRVQGAGAAEEIAEGIARMNAHRAADVLIVGRGGGSLEDLWAFNEEAVVRAIVASEIPVVSAVGHETDWSLADLAADVRAATPSHAAEMIVPVASDVLAAIAQYERDAAVALERRATEAAQNVDVATTGLALALSRRVESAKRAFEVASGKLDALSPLQVLARGFAVATGPDGRVLTDASAAPAGTTVRVRLARGALATRVEANEEGA
ncbi:MAG: exodeoxyribonuclease VII large subunit [Thermoplasmatota archaeon]